MPGERFFSARDRLLDCYHRIDEVAEASGIPPKEDSEGARRKLAQPLRVVALGEVNAGKSTLLNALVGFEMCPAGPLPTTQRTSWYRYTSAAKEVERRDGWVEVGRPLSFLREFELVDTPGSNSGWRDGVFTDLPRFEAADLLLVVFPASNTWTAATWELVSKLSDEGLEKTVLIIQQSDQKSPEDLQVIRGHMRDLCLKKVGRELPIHSVAAGLALEAKINPETGRKGWSASGFLAFEEFLSEDVCHSVAREHLLHRTSQEANRRLRQIEEGLDRQRRGMDDDGWFLAGLERESDQLRDMILEMLGKTLEGARGRYEAEVATLGKTVGRSLGMLPTTVRLFIGDSTPAKIEADFAAGLQDAVRDFAEMDAERLLEECEGHWNDVRPRVVERMGMDPGESKVTGELRDGVVEKFTSRVGKAAGLLLGQLRVRALLDGPVRRRNQRLRGLMAVVLVLLTGAGVAGSLGQSSIAYGLLLGAGGMGLLLLLAMWLGQRAVVKEVRGRLLDSVGQLEEALAGDYAEAVRGLFREYSNSLIGVRRQLAERKSTLEPRVERWNALYLELKSIEQDME